MSFLVPAFLLGALAIAIPIVLHFLRRDVAPEVPFSAVRLISTSPVERSRRRRLRDLLLLAARVAALLLLATAFARPYVAGSASDAGVYIVALDRSFSLGGPERFEDARRLAREALDDAPRGMPVALIAFDDRADVLAPAGSVADARAALDEVRPGFGGTRYEPVLARASELAAGGPGRLVVVTDLQRTGWDERRRAMLASPIALEVRDAGAPPANLAIADVRAEPERIAVSVRNAGPVREARVRLAIDGREVASGSETIGAGETGTVTIRHRLPASGALTVSVDDPGGLPADDRRHLLVDRAGSASALIVAPPGASQAGFYLSRAIAVAAEEDPASGLSARVVPAPSVASLKPGQMDNVRVVVLLATRGLDRRAREELAARVRSGSGLLIAAGPEVEPAVISTIFGWKPALSADAEPRQGVRLAASDLRHPVFRPFGPLLANLGQVTVQRAWTVEPEGWDVLARLTDGSPALLERREGQGRVMLFTSDLDRGWNDFPVQPLFVPFVIETLRYASAGAAGGRSYTIGQVPPGVPPEPGIHTLGDTGRLVAVNVDPGESLADRLTPAEFEGMIERVAVNAAPAAETRAREVESRQSLWQYGLLLMLVTLVVESFVGRVA